MREKKEKPVKQQLADTPSPVPQLHADIRQRAMLVNLTIHQWLASAMDEKITDEVAATHGIDAAMGRYQKSLLGKTALVRIRAIASKLRSTHKKYTLPWSTGGTRILSAKAFLTYNAEMTGLISEYQQVFYDEFAAIGPNGVSKYEDLKREAKRLLNGAYRDADYPALSQLKSKYGASVTVDPIPAADDFRIDLGAEATAQVRREIESRAAKQVSEAMRSLYERLQFLIDRLVKALKGENNEAIRKSLFTGIHTLVDSLPILNVTGDPQLEMFAANIREVIAGLESEELRDGPALRAVVLKRADAILAQMNDFLG